MKSQWLKYDGDRYYIKADGYMAVNKWVKDSKGRLWVGSNGKIVKSKWLKYGGNWYYLKADGTEGEADEAITLTMSDGFEKDGEAEELTYTKTLQRNRSPSRFSVAVKESVADVSPESGAQALVPCLRYHW